MRLGGGMDRARRGVLRQGGRIGMLAWLAAAGVLPAAATEVSPVFALRGVDAVLAALGAAGARMSEAVQIDAAEIVEDGSMVSLTVSARLPGVRQIALLADANPTTLVALYALPEGTVPRVQTRIRMAQTSHVIAVVEAADGFFLARREIKIVQGGCG